mgnify:CR=1 FL=1
MGTHIHVGTANRRNALALLLLALVMLFNSIRQCSKWHFPALNGKKPIGCK